MRRSRPVRVPPARAASNKTLEEVLANIRLDELTGAGVLHGPMTRNASDTSDCDSDSCNGVSDKIEQQAVATETNEETPANIAKNEKLETVTNHDYSDAAMFSTSVIFTTYELVENILSHLSFKDLTRVQRVSKKWYDVTIRSPTLRRQLSAFSEAKVHSIAPVVVHPLIASPYYGPDCFHTPYPMARVRKLLKLQKGQWENMFMCVPALTMVRINGPKGRRTDPLVIEDRSGVRLGAYVAGVREWVEHDLGRVRAQDAWDTRMMNGHQLTVSISLIYNGFPV